MNEPGWDEASDEEDDEQEYKTDILWLCQEGQLKQALSRVQKWELVQTTGCDGEAKEICPKNNLKELFRTNEGGNSAIHEAMMAYSSDQDGEGVYTNDLVRILAEMSSVDPIRQREMFTSAPRGSHGRTLLHWAAWRKSDVSVVNLFVSIQPDALCKRDYASHGRRTPLEIAERYWPDSDLTHLLRRLTASYMRYSIRLTVHLCAYRHFVTNRVTPMKDDYDDDDVACRNFVKARKRRKKPFFALSILGYALQREMIGLVLHILSFLGTTSAKRKTQNRTRKMTKSPRKKRRIKHNSGR